MESLSQYHIFYTVAKNGSISAAANELFISQPAVSKSIKKLEELLQTTLFIRGSRGVKCTEDGRIFVRASCLCLFLDSGGRTDVTAQPRL